MSKKKVLDTEKIMSENPLIDPRQVAEVRRALKELRRKGIEDSGYNLVVPFSRSEPTQTGRVEDTGTHRIRFRRSR
jgi:hypothetical protein